MSEENASKTTQVSTASTETVKLPDLYTAMAGICYNHSQKVDENKSLIETHSDSSSPLVKPEGNRSEVDNHSSLENVSAESAVHTQTYHNTEVKNLALANHQISGYSGWEQMACPSLQNYHGAQAINPLAAAAAAAQYSEYYNLSSRSGGVVYEDWQYPMYYSNYYDAGTDMSKYCEQKNADAVYEKSKMTPENCHDSGSDRTCSTPDLVLSVLQMENQIKNEMSSSKDRLSHWYSPVSSPDCSPAVPLTAESPAPSTEQDSGFFSEDPVSPIFMSHKQTVTQLEETNQKYFVYVPENGEDWKSYHHINPMPLVCTDMTRKMVNKSAICGWKPTTPYPMFTPDLIGRSNGYKPETETWPLSKYPQFPMSMTGKNHKPIKTKAARPIKCVTPIPSSTVTSGCQVQSDAVSSSLPPSSVFQGSTGSSTPKCSPTSSPPVVPVTVTTKSTKDLVDGFISRKSNTLPILPVTKVSQPAKRKSSAMEEKMPIGNKRIRHNEPLNTHAISVMQRWYDQNQDNPYPSKQDKEDIARLGGISITQVKSWFANKRNRTNNTRPKVQKRNVEEKLLDLCHQLASDARKSTMDNAFVIQQLSAIIDEHHAIH